MKRHAFLVRAAFAAVVVCSSAFAPACGSDTETGSTTDNGDGSTTGDGGNNTGDGTGGNVTDGPTYDGNSYNGTPGQCTPLVGSDGTSPQCADCKDNDGDGKIDWLDPECAGPLDNDEATFGTGIPGDNMDACKQDCFFDGNSGAGDDKCEWNLKCDPLNTSGICPYDKNYKNCPATQADQCKKYCAALTPNGCDCFGCCTVTLPGGGTKDVKLSSTCSVADINDPAKCNPCTKVADCQNDCGPCELCIGKTTIDPSCAPADAGTTDSGTPDPLAGQTCSIPGAQACNAQAPCPNGTYCVTGCCIQIVN
jgi:hypothetical protein